MAEQTQKFSATGKRKSAIAQVRVSHGAGQIVVNRRALEDYFGRPTSRMIVNQPFEVTETLGRWDVSVNVKGGGVSAQAQAVRHGISRAMLLVDPNYRPTLKKAGFITRDSREVESKKYGHHKARKRPQYSKR
ncbi:MAG: 30S ribosomal protein S9 [Candidatus Binatia bacterium]|nr:30S ribosomal protein S9 [Candidatus Binatia bacterium]